MYWPGHRAGHRSAPAPRGLGLGGLAWRLDGFLGRWERAEPWVVVHESSGTCAGLALAFGLLFCVQIGQLLGSEVP